MTLTDFKKDKPKRRPARTAWPVQAESILMRIVEWCDFGHDDDVLADIVRDAVHLLKEPKGCECDGVS